MEPCGACTAMECFAFNTAVDPTMIRVRDSGFGTPIEFGEVATIRCLLRAEEAEFRLADLFARFMEEVRRDHARGELEQAHQWALQASTQLHSDLPLSLRIFRELLPQAFLMTLFGPANEAQPPRYLFNGLHELRGIHGNLVFTGTAVRCELDAKTEKLEGEPAALSTQ